MASTTVTCVDCGIDTVIYHAFEDRRCSSCYARRLAADSAARPLSPWVARATANDLPTFDRHNGASAYTTTRRS